ncbi:hypothetical protein EDC04DRAFT_2812338 [Pisolithus marmoratus]|nr:hypothetical protein EDC04DRAFT_2812338 [Pisolithus marmoratus]
MFILISYLISRACTLCMPSSATTGITEQLRRCLFLTFLGEESLEKLIEISGKKDKIEWNELKRRLTERTANINVIGSLGVGACASFLTTTPPTTLADWNHVFPYAFIGASMWCSVLSVITGLSLLVFLNVFSIEHLQSAQTSMFKRVLLVTLLMMPLMFLTTAGACAGVGWLGAAWFGNVLWIKFAMAFGRLLLFFFPGCDCCCDLWNAGQPRFGTAEFGKFVDGVTEVRKKDTGHCGNTVIRSFVTR